MDNKPTMTQLLTREQRMWLQDCYAECDIEINGRDGDYDLIIDNLEHMEDDELLDECIAFMPEILRDFEIQFNETILATY